MLQINNNVNLRLLWYKPYIRWWSNIFVSSMMFGKVFCTCWHDGRDPEIRERSILELQCLLTKLYFNSTLQNNIGEI